MNCAGNRKEVSSAELPEEKFPLIESRKVPPIERLHSLPMRSHDKKSCRRVSFPPGSYRHGWRAGL